MNINTIKLLGNLFIRELSIIKVGGLTILFLFSFFTTFYLVDFIIDIAKSNYTQGTIESIETKYHTTSRKYSSIPDYNAIIGFIDSDYNYHTFKSFSIGNFPIGQQFGVFYRIDSYTGLKAYSSIDVMLLLLFYTFLCITPTPAYLLIIEYLKKNLYRQYKKEIKSIYKKGMLFWFYGILFSGFGGGTLWIYFEGKTLIAIGGIILIFITFKNIRKSFAAK